MNSTTGLYIGMAIGGVTAALLHSILQIQIGYALALGCFAFSGWFGVLILLGVPEIKNSPEPPPTEG